MQKRLLREEKGREGNAMSNGFCDYCGYRLPDHSDPCKDVSRLRSELAAALKAQRVTVYCPECEQMRKELAVLRTMKQAAEGWENYYPTPCAEILAGRCPA
jgi:hypothetical protein